MPRILHAALEYKQGVGGIKSVLTGLIPAQVRKGDLDVAVITPFFDVYQAFYADKTIEKLGIFKHIYKGKIFTSELHRVCTDNVDAKPIFHYMIGPATDSPVAWIFKIREEKNLYQAFPYSEPGNRVEYFVGALAALLRLGLSGFPEFDIFHAHAWHCGLAACVAKEFENLTLYSELNADNLVLRQMPLAVSTVHMLTSAEHGQLTTIESVRNFLRSLGLPFDLVHKFPTQRKAIQENYLKRVVLALLYADMVTVVSKGLESEVKSGNAAGLEPIFDALTQQERIYGITNGITEAKWDATKPENLPEFYFQPAVTPISVAKHKIKQKLITTYPQLDPNKPWFVFVGRFGIEKGVDMFLSAADAASAAGANLIIMGTHVARAGTGAESAYAFEDIFAQLKTKPDLVVIDTAEEQKAVGRLFRAACQYMLVLSHNEACGLVPMEGCANAAMAVGPRIQGIPDSVRDFNENPTKGTGFLYSDDPETRVASLTTAINQAVEFYKARVADKTLDVLLMRLLDTAKEFDWDAKPSSEYKALYLRVLQRPLLTSAQIHAQRAVPMLSQFASMSGSCFSGKIFQLGFNKCGSQTIHNYFWVNGIKCLHYGNARGSVARSIQINALKGEPLLEPEYDEYYGFFDMEDPYADPPIYIAQSLFKELDQQYPGSKFILNTRSSKDKWIQSRLAHVDQSNGKKYVEVLMDKYHCSREDLVARWSKEWDLHHSAVLDYFKDRAQDLLVIDIDAGTDLEKGQKISDFFAGRFLLDPIKFGHLNKTPAEHKAGAPVLTA